MQVLLITDDFGSAHAWCAGLVSLGHRVETWLPGAADAGFPAAPPIGRSLLLVAGADAPGADRLCRLARALPGLGEGFLLASFPTSELPDLLALLAAGADDVVPWAADVALVDLRLQVGARLARERQAQGETEARHRLFDEVPVGLYRTTPEGRLLDANAAVVRMLGFPDRATLLAANSAAMYLRPEDRLRWQQAVETEGTPQSFESQMRRLDGSVIWGRFSVRGVRDGEGRVVCYEGAMEDVTERKLAEERLVHEALHDDLTGLPNRALFMDRLAAAMARARKSLEARLTAVLFLDVDRFKAVNDSFGHPAGDDLLRQVAATLAGSLRPADTVARMGGDEFAILLEGGRGVADAVLVAERIHDRLSAPFDLSGQTVHISASVGIAVLHAGYERPEELLRDADTAMYRAKAAGRACHVVFHPDLAGIGDRAEGMHPAGDERR